MDAELKATLNKIMDALTVLLDRLIPPPGTVPVPVPPSPPVPPVQHHGPTLGAYNDGAWEAHVDPTDPNKPFLHDYWFIGHPGAQKGVYLNLWAAGKQMISMMGGFYTGNEHLYVFKLMPDPAAEDWRNAMVSVADLGWMDGSAFTVDDTEGSAQAQARWTAAGRPSTDAEGYLIVGGRYSYNQKHEKLKKGDDSEFVVK